MKQIININANVKTSDQACSSKYYGVTFGLDNRAERGFITRTQWHHMSGEYCVRTSDDFTNGNGWTQCNNVSLTGCINTVLVSYGNSKVYEFDSFKELMVWILDLKIP